MTEEIHPGAKIVIDINTNGKNNSNIFPIKEKKQKFKLEFDEEGIPILSRQRIYFSVAALCVAVFLGSLDSTIIATALPTITNKFNAADSVHWLISANFLANACSQPLFGKISDIFGRKETLITAIFIFEIGSIISGTANSINTLIFSRAFTGVGAAGIQALVQIVISEMVPLRERGRYSGLIGVSFGLASVVGPLLGGAFTDHVSYRWCFYINIPLGVIAGLFIAILVKTKRPVGSMMEKVRRFDFIGALLLVCGLVMILMGLNFGGNEHAWISATVLCLIIVGILVIFVYIFYDLKLAKEPVLPLKLFKKRNIWSVVCAQFLMGFGLYGVVYAAPAYASAVHNATASKAGIFLIPFVLGLMVFSVGSGLFTTFTGKYRVMFRTGTFVLAVGTGLMVSINENTKGALTAFFLVICGIGCGLCMQAFIICVQATVPRSIIASATSAVVFARIFSGAVGITLSDIVQKSILTRNLAKLLEEFPQSADTILTALKNTSAIYSPGIDSALQLGLIQSYVKAITSSFKLFCGAMCLSFVLTMLTKHIVLLGKGQGPKTVQHSPAGSTHLDIDPKHINELSPTAETSTNNDTYLSATSTIDIENNTTIAPK